MQTNLKKPYNERTPLEKLLFHVKRPFAMAIAAYHIMKFKHWATYASDPNRRALCKALYELAAYAFNNVSYFWLPKFPTTVRNLEEAGDKVKEALENDIGVSFERVTIELGEVAKKSSEQGKVKP